MLTKDRAVGGKRLYHPRGSGREAAIGGGDRTGPARAGKDLPRLGAEVADSQVARGVGGPLSSGSEVDGGAVFEVAGHGQLPRGFAKEGVDHEDKGGRADLQRGQRLGQVEAGRV